jgi:hypothetical protein
LLHDDPNFPGMIPFEPVGDEDGEAVDELRLLTIRLASAGG